MSSIMFQNNSDCSCNSCSSQQKYFEISKCFEELNTEIQKAQARYNLGIGDEQNLKWGNIKGFIEEQTDIIEYLNNYIADLNKLVAAIELVPDVTSNDFNIVYKTLDSNNEEIEESKQITLPIATPTSAGIMSKEDKAKLDKIQSLIPLMISESPIVGTGIEYRAAKDSGILVLAEDDGVIEKVTADAITVFL